MNLAPEVALLVAAIDELDKLVDLTAGLVPEIAIAQPWVDAIRATADKLQAAAIAHNPAAAEVAAADAATAAAEDVKFGAPGTGPK
jgi:hypothetical protein